MLLRIQLLHAESLTELSPFQGALRKGWSSFASLNQSSQIVSLSSRLSKMLKYQDMAITLILLVLSVPAVTSKGKISNKGNAKGLLKGAIKRLEGPG